MREFGVDGAGGVITVDFDVNLPVFVMTAFAVWSGEVFLAGSKVGPATPAGIADYEIPGAIARPSILVCQFNCLADGRLVGEELRVTVHLQQDERRESYVLEPVELRSATASGVTVAQVQKTVAIGLA